MNYIYKEEILEGVDEAVSTLERMISEERVEELLSTLTDLQRKVVHIHLFHGLSFTEAAKHLGMTRQNLTGIYNAAIYKIQKKHFRAYSFYRVPKALIKVDLFEKMSGDAKLLYAVLLDRMNLSLKNGWQDENGNAYIICTIDEIMDSIRCARQKAVKLLDELEHEYQLIERRRQGLGKPNLLYVKDLYAGLSQSNYWKYENQTSGGLKSELPGVWKSNGSKTDINNTDSSETDLIYSAQSGENISGEMREDERYRFYFQDKLEIPILEKNFPHDREILMEILELLVETVTSRKKFLRICGEEKPKEVVKSRLMKLDSMHIKSLQQSGAQLTNIVVTDNNIKSFDRVARKYGIDYSLKKAEKEGKTEYLVFFKAKDVDVMTAAFKEYTGVSLKKEQRQSIRKKLEQAKERVAKHREITKEKTKDRGQVR